MRRAFLTLTILLSLLSVSAFIPLQQSNTITILNRAGQPTTQITDGDTLKLQVTLSQSVTNQDIINFTLGDQVLSVLVGSCVIENGGTTCTTESFSALGWHWDANGVAQNTRTVQAFNANNELIGQSNPLNVNPRPVVMVH